MYTVALGESQFSYFFSFQVNRHPYSIQQTQIGYLHLTWVIAKLHQILLRQRLRLQGNKQINRDYVIVNMKESFFLEKSNHYYMGKLRLMLSPNPGNTGIGQRKRQNRLDMTGCPEEEKRLLDQLTRGVVSGFQDWSHIGYIKYF